MKLLRILIAYVLAAALCYWGGAALMQADPPAYQIGLLAHSYPLLAAFVPLALWLFAL